MRSLGSTFKTRVAAREILVGCFCFIDYPTTPLRAWSGTGDLSWNSQTWKGVGDFGGFSAITERVGPEAAATKLTLNGIKDELVNLALLDTSRLRLVELHLAVMTETAGVWAVEDAWRFFRARTDVHRIIEGKEFHTIEVALETFLATMRRPRVVRYTNAEQQRLYPGDRGMEYAGKINLTPLTWGAATPAAATAPGAGNPKGSSSVFSV
ncbi:MAG: hypothetical protein H3C27_15475 [Opitutaceae bacterium]|nr:hypothetical protein [Opitutaceae bacterium]